MTNVIFAEPSLLIGGWELLVIATVLLLLIGVPAVIALVVFLVARSRSQHQPAAPAAPPEISTQQLPRTCPKCGAELKPDAPEGLCPSCLLKQGIATEGAEPVGQTPFIPPTIAELARLFPQLEILEPIGKGGMGAVYKARQPALERFVALKILAPRSGSDLDFESRFSREARALARLNHPNIVAVYDFGHVQRPPSSPPAAAPAVEPPPQSLNYFIMEFVDGPNLRQIEQAGKLSPREALQVIPQICAALQFAHDEGIVHRDIKPENVLLDKKGRVKIADFGLAKILGTEPQDLRLTGAKDVMGTPHYMAPEQVETPQEVDHRADIYSLGVVFYEMLTGELPLGKFQPPSNKVSIDVRLDDVVLRALAKEPERRYQQASALKTEIETIASTPGAAAAPPIAPSAAGSAESSSRLSRTAVIGFIWASLIFAAGFWWLILPRLVSSESPAASRVFLVLLGSPFLALGFSAPLGTTILGWVAVSQIRRAAGRIHGLGLAVFDGLLFPLLFLDAVLAFGFFILLRLLVMTNPLPERFRSSPFWILVPLFFFTLIGLVDYLIVQRVWVAVKRSMGDALPSPPSAGSWKKPVIILGSALAIPIALIVIALIWSNTRRTTADSFDWQQTSVDDSIEASTGAATLRVTGFNQNGPVLEVTFLSEPGFAPQQLVVSFPGPAIESPFPEFDATNVDCLIAPTRNSFGHEALGQLLAGTNVLRGPGQFRIGFVFPDEGAAAKAAMQAEQLHLGKPRGLEWEQSLRLFSLTRRIGTDSLGHPVFESLIGEIAVHQIPVGAVERKLVRVEEDIPGPIGSGSSHVEYRSVFVYTGTNGLEFRWVARGSETNLPADELSYTNGSTGTKLSVLKEVVLDESDVLGAAQVQHEPPLGKEIAVTLTESGTMRLADLTAKNIGRQLAIVWEGRVLSAPVIRDALTGRNISITGNFSDRDCERLLSALNHVKPAEMSGPEADEARRRQLLLLVLQADQAKLTNMLVRDGFQLSSAPVRYVLQQIADLQRQLTNTPAASPEQLASNLNSRLDAAREILAFPDRDKVLAGIAHDAAHAGNAAITKRALSQITAFTTRDAAARDAARTLAKDGHRDEAFEIARTITSFTERDAALQELAK